MMAACYNHTEDNPDRLTWKMARQGHLWLGGIHICLILLELVNL